jgi:hypothetical protein
MIPISEFHGQICYNNARLWRHDAQRHQSRRTLRVPRGRAARGRPWLGASERHDPRTIDALKVPFELILYEFPREVLEAYCAAKGLAEQSRRCFVQRGRTLLGPPPGCRGRSA